MKKMECGMGELSHCLLYHISFIEVGVISARRRCIFRPAGRHRPSILLHAVDEDGHLLGRLVDIHQDLLAGRVRLLTIGTGGVALVSGCAALVWGCVGLVPDWAVAPDWAALWL